MSRILLLLHDQENRQWLAAELAKQYHVTIPDEETNEPIADVVALARFDLCLVDAPAFEQYRHQLEVRKASEEPVFLPVVLVGDRRHLHSLALPSWHSSVDDVLLTPTLPVELNLRVDSLLRTRRLSLEMQQRKIKEMLEATSLMQHSEESFRLLIEGLTDYAIFMLDIDGRVTSWNIGAERIMGYRAEKILGAHFSCFYTREDIRCDKPAQELQMVLTADQCEDEGVRVRQDRSQFWANMTITALRDANKEHPKGEKQELVGFSVIIHDLSERKKIDEELCQANRSLRLLCDCNQALVRASEESELLHDICRIIVEIGKYRACWVDLSELGNPDRLRTVARSGVELEQLRGENEAAEFSIFTGTDTAQNFGSDFHHYPMCEPTAGCGGSFLALPLLDANRKKDKGKLEAEAPSLQTDLFGVLTIYIAEPDTFKPQEVQLLQELANDVAYGIISLRTRVERSKAQAALQESEERYRQLIELSPEAIIVQSYGKIDLINSAGVKLLGATRSEQLIGQPARDFVHPDYQEMLTSRTDIGTAETQEVRFTEQKLRRLDGTEVDVESAATFFSYQSVPAVLTVARDLTERKQMEEALRQSEELHRLTLSNISEAVLITDNSGDFTYICPNIHLVFNRSLEEVQALGNIAQLLGENLFDRNHLEISGEIQNIEWQPTEKIGIHRTLLVSVKRVSINNGTILYTCRDITERVQAEAALKQSEELLRTVVETLPVGIWFTDRQGKILLVNPAGEQIWGGLRYLNAERYAEYKGWWADTGKPLSVDEWAGGRAIIKGETSINDVIDIQCFDGKRKTILNSAVPLRNAQQEVTGAIIVNQDITELRQVQEALRESNRRIVNILESITDAFFALDRQWHFTYINRQAEQLLQKNRQELLGKNIWDVFSEAVGSIFLEQYQQAVSTGIAVSFEGFYQPLNTWFEVHAYPGEDGLAVYFQDVSERKQAQEALLESAHQLRAVFEGALDAMIVVDDTGHFVVVNPAAGVIFGLSPAELINRHIMDFVPEAGLDFEQAWQIFRSKGRITGEFRLQRPDKTLVEIEYSAVANFLPNRHLSVMRDITNRKRTEQELKQYREQLELLVEARTGELTKANEQLQQEICSRSRVEAAHRQSEEQLRTLINAMPDIVCFKDGQGRWLEANDAILQLFELEGLNYLGQTDSDLANLSGFYRDAFLGCERTDEAAWNNGKLSRAEEVIPQPNGAIKIYDVIKVPLFDDCHNRKGLVLLGRDITERKRAEGELVRLASIVESSDDAIVSKTLDGIVVSWNAGAEKIYGYSTEEMKGRSMNILAPPDHPFEMRRILERIEQGGRLEHYETMRMRKDGQPIHVSMTISPIVDAVGRIIGVSTIARDITDRKRIEAALERLRHQNELILNSAGEGICGLDARGRTTFVNPAASRMVGYELKELLGQPIHILLQKPLIAYRGEGKPASEEIPNGQFSNPLASELGSAPVRTVEALAVRSASAKGVGVYKCPAPAYQMPADHSPQDCPIYASLQDGSVHHLTNEVFWRKDGSCFPVEYVSTPIREQGAIVGAVVTFKDITERLAVERMKEEFISVVSHELRTPLTSMRGALGLLAAGLLSQSPQKAQRMLDIAVTNTDRLVRLINDILDLERIQSSKIAMNKQICNAGDLMLQAADTMRTMAEKAGVALSVVPVDAELWADPDRILQALTNLLSNAIKYSSSGTIVGLAGEVGSSSLANHRDGQLLISVKDQGRGIPADKLETIFERFQQVDSSDSRQKGGTGLGLAICRSIVHQHDGEIWVESALGEGSTFCFTLPLVRRD